MTLRKVVRDIYESLGEVSDLEIYSDPTTETIDYASRGWSRFVDMVNEAQLAIMTWKFDDGRQIRLRLPDAHTMFQSRVLTGTVTVVSGSTIDFTSGGLPVGNDSLYGYLITSSDASGVVLNSTGTATAAQVVLYKTSGTFEVGDTISIALREYTWTSGTRIQPTLVTGIPYIAAQGQPLEILGVYDSDGENELDIESKYDIGLSVNTNPSTPASYYKIPNGIRFDVWPDEQKMYDIRYIRGPAVYGYTAAEADLELSLPPQFHPAVILYGIWRGYRRLEESSDSYSAKRDLVDCLRRAQTEYDLQDNLTRGQIKFYPDGRS